MIVKCICGQKVSNDGKNDKISGTICDTCWNLIHDEKDCRRRARWYQNEGLGSLAKHYEALANRIQATLKAKEAKARRRK